VSQEIIEDQVTSSPLDDLGSLFQKLIFRKLIRKGELLASNSLLDLLQLLPRATQVGF